LLTFRSPHSRFWLLIFALFILSFWVLKPMLLPFAAAFTIAYFLNPLVNRLERASMRRWAGTALILLSFILCVILALALIVPLIQTQVATFLQALPGYIQTFQQNAIPWAERIAARYAPNGAEQLQTAAQQYAGDAVGWIGKVLQQVISGGMAIFDVLTLLIITPVVSFYFLRDWPKITATIDSLIPRQHYDDIRQQLGEIDKALSGFIRGQALVCLGLGIIYSAGLTLAGLEYGATIGITAGVLSFIPYVGTVFAFVSSIILALIQFPTLLGIAPVIVAIFVGQVVESYYLTPKLVGDRVGLHPVWVIFALFAGGSLMGFAGILIAVPLAAAIGVLVRHGVHKYRHSILFDKTWPAGANHSPASPAPPTKP
jgi:predicted PurR-regulated permease PerM